MTDTNESTPTDFIREKVAADVRDGKHGGKVVTRFPPEPNGYLHIGHAKAICIDFGIAAEFGGNCNLRFDDTNPTREEEEFVKAIQEDVRWLGWEWANLCYASDYFEKMYEYAVRLIEDGKAYVCDLPSEEIREYRGTLTAPGRESPYRDRAVGENLDLFARMRKGEIPDGSRVLRAKIDMASPNLNLRDPVMYRILHAHHHRTGDAWCIYPTYDWAHGLEDAIEGVTHSLCDIEFENHRPLYDWFLEQLGVHRPQQIEFSRLNITYTVMSKRKLRELVEGRQVEGWDDPRLPTLCGLRRRGYTAESIKAFLRKVGVTKFTGYTDIALLEHCLRDELNRTAPRVMAVLRPLKLIIDNYPEDSVEELAAVNNPEDPSAGSRQVPFSRELYVERDDFAENPPKKFHRLALGREVRLRYAYFVMCTSVVKDDATGEITEVHCTYDPETRGGDAPDGRKVRGTVHWVSAAQAAEIDVRLYDRLFTVERPEDVPDGGDFRDTLNPASYRQQKAFIEPGALALEPGARCQFERLGYFCVDPSVSREGNPVFNRIVPLRDSWAKAAGSPRRP